MGFPSWVAAALILGACAPEPRQSAPAPGFNRVQARGPFTVDLPIDLLRKEAWGIDSAVDVYERPGLQVAFDYGLYGGFPGRNEKTLDYRTGPLRIGGYPGKFATYNQQPNGVEGFRGAWVGYAWGLDDPPGQTDPVDRDGAHKLTIYVACKALVDCDLGQTIAHSVRFTKPPRTRLKLP